MSDWANGTGACEPVRAPRLGIRAWLNGLTIAECQTTVLALEYDALRAAVGDAKFDAHFGSATAATADGDRLRISPESGRSGSELPQAHRCRRCGRCRLDREIDRPKVGEWYYYYDHRIC